MRSTFLASAALVLALTAAACGPRAVPPTTMEVLLSGGDEVPPVETEATGSANVTVAGNVMTVDGSWDGFDIAAPGAHIHGPAAPGANAGVVFPLDYDNAARSFGGTFTLNEEQMGWFADGLLYINLHSAAYPAGEIRGQIEP